MSLFLDRVDSVPLPATDFSFEFYLWLATLTDSLNETFQTIENFVNFGIPFPPFTTAEIEALVTAGNVQNGTGFYCTDSSPPNIVFYINDTLLQINTSAFP